MLNTMAIVIVFILVCMTLNGVRVFVQNKWFLKKDFWGDKIKGRFKSLVKPGARDLVYSFNNERCNYCGQKNLAELEYTDYFPGTRNPARLRDDNMRHYLCGSCGCKFEASMYEVEVRVLRGCTDPIPELRRPATHGEVKTLFEPEIVRLHVCKTCDGSELVKVPSSVNTGELWGEWEDAPCPDCYRADAAAPAPPKSARRRAIEHTKEKNRGVSNG